MIRYAIFVLLLQAAALHGAAPAFQDLDSLDRQVAIALGADIGAPGGAAAPIDRRLKLAACPAITVEAVSGGAATVRCQALGWRLRVPVQRGTGASTGPAAAVVRAEPVVRRGDPVEMMVATGGFTVSMQAVAEQDGAPGQRIRVRADAKSAPRMVEVVDAGRVRIPGFK